jgi:hypothetical protein
MIATRPGSPIVVGAWRRSGEELAADTSASVV